MKKMFILLLLLLLAGSITAQAGFLDPLNSFFEGFTGSAIAGYGNIEGDCKRYVSINEGQTKAFGFGLDSYEFELVSLLDSTASIKINGIRYTLPIPSERTIIDSKLSINVNKIIQTDLIRGITITLNKEDDKCSCVSNDIKLKKGIKNIVSDGRNQFEIIIKELYIDRTGMTTNNYAIYSVDGYETEKAYADTTVVLWELNGLKIKTKSINQDNTVVIMIDNSNNCVATQQPKKAEIEKPISPTINLGTETTAQVLEYKKTSILYTLEIPAKNQKQTYIVTPEGKFDLEGNKIQEEQPPPTIPRQKKGFWQCLWG